MSDKEKSYEFQKKTRTLHLQRAVHDAMGWEIAIRRGFASFTDE